MGVVKWGGGWLNGREGGKNGGGDRGIKLVDVVTRYSKNRE